MSSYNINVLVLSTVSQVSAMVAVSTSQLPPASYMCGGCGQFTLPSETTSLHINVDIELELDFEREGSLRYLGYTLSRQ